jgi:hypothetical protein
MDCRTARLLLPYAARPAELGPEDTAELNAHLASCPQCAAQARAERSFDAAVGQAMTAVAVPLDLKAQIDARLARARGPRWRRSLAQLSAAAAALLLVASLIWLGTYKTPVQAEYIAVNWDNYVSDLRDPDRVKDYFRQQGMVVEIPDDFDWDALYWRDVTDFKGHQVARLDFQRGEAKAHIFVLPKSHFRIEKGAPTKYESSRCTVELIDWSKDVIVLIVYQSGATRQNFQKNAIVG